MLAIRHSNDSFEVRSRSADKWPFFSNRKETKEEENLDFCPFSLIMNCAYGSAVCGWSPKARFNESSGIKYHLQRSQADMLDCDICFKAALRRRCQTDQGCRSAG